MSSNIVPLRSTLDFSELEVIKNNAQRMKHKETEDAVLKIEGLFINMMLKSMRASIPEAELLNSNHIKLYTSLYDQELSQNLTNHGIGLAKVLRQHINKNNILSLAHFNKIDSFSYNPEHNAIHSHERKLISFHSINNRKLASSRIFFNKQLNLNPELFKFINRIIQPALKASLDTGLPHELILAQAALESGWGRREIRTANGKLSYNLFGIKSGPKWDGESAKITTTELVNGIKRKVKAKFRVYSSYNEAIQDYINFLKSNSRYQNIFKASTLEKAAQLMQSSGYSTDPNYAEKLIKVSSQLLAIKKYVQQSYQFDIKK